MQKVVLISGAFGFVGSNLSAYLAGKGFELWALDVEDSAGMRECTNARVENGRSSPYARFFNWNQLEDIPWSEVYAVVHLAGKAHDTKNASDPQSYFDINTELAEKVLGVFSRKGASVSAESCAQTEKAQIGEGKFILFSSVKAVADRADGVLTEEKVPDPQTPYGQSKLAAEKLVLNNSHTRTPTHLSTYVLRPCMIHGPGNKGNLNLLYNIVKKGIPWPLGAFENERSFASIENVCAVVNGVLEKDVDPGVYQVADDDTISTNRLIQLIAESQSKGVRIVRVSKGLISFVAKLGDVLRFPLNSERLKKLTESYVVSNAKIKMALGWGRMPVSAEDGIRRTLQSFSGN